MQSPMSGNVQIPIKWNFSVESHIILRLWVFEEIRRYLDTDTILRAESYFGNIIGKTNLFPY